MDGDGLTAAVEVPAGASPFLPDTDGDGLDDAAELNPPPGTPATNPASRDSDGDGLLDAEEIAAGQDGVVTHPWVADSDGDAIPDGQDGTPLDKLVFYHGDHLGSATSLTNHQGTELARVLYKPFGAAVGGAPPTFGFTGQRFEAEVGLYDYGARWYDPVLGRFLSPDGVVPGPINPQALNRYGYVLNNPLNSIDPSGHWQVSFDLGFFGFTFGTDRSTTGDFGFQPYWTAGIGFDVSWQVGEDPSPGDYDPGDVYGFGINFGFRGGEHFDLSFGPNVQWGNKSLWGSGRGFLGANVRVADFDGQIARAVSYIDGSVFGSGDLALGYHSISSPASFGDAFIASPYVRPAEDGWKTYASTVTGQATIYGWTLVDKPERLIGTVFHENVHLNGVYDEAPAYMLTLEHAPALSIGTDYLRDVMDLYESSYRQEGGRSNPNAGFYGLRDPREFRERLGK